MNITKEGECKYIAFTTRKKGDRHWYNYRVNQQGIRIIGIGIACGTYAGKVIECSYCGQEVCFCDYKYNFINSKYKKLE